MKIVFLFPFLATVAFLASTRAQKATIDLTIPIALIKEEVSVPVSSAPAAASESSPWDTPYSGGAKDEPGKQDQIWDQKKKDCGKRNHGIGQGKGKGFEKGNKGQGGNVRQTNKEGKGNKGHGQGQGKN